MHYISLPIHTCSDTTQTSDELYSMKCIYMYNVYFKKYKKIKKNMKNG